MPKAPVAWSTSPQVQPPSTRTVWAAGFTVVLRKPPRSITSASSQTPKPPPLVRSSADGECHVVLPCEVDAGDHIGDVGAPNDRSRSPVDRSVVDGPGLVVTRVRGERESAPYSSRELAPTGDLWLATVLL